MRPCGPTHTDDSARGATSSGGPCEPTQANDSARGATAPGGPRGSAATNVPRAAGASRDDYETFCDGVRGLCHVDLAQYKRGQMERRIRSFAHRRGSDGLTDYLTVLRREPSELDDFLDRMTINVSQLWRNPEQWALIGDSILPELAAAGRGITAWSAGCSYGAEAYTLAALCRENAPGARATIRGTDIDKRMVERAHEGRFTDEDARTAPRALLERHFDAVDGGWRARRELRDACRFEVGDLLRMTVAPGRLDLVLCRNTVIYFTDDVRNALHARLAQALRPGGYLVIGSTERVQDPREMDLTPTHPFVYRKA
ncbi:CheR family methyltransferase [Capillimicrobium parvum]|uniref:protein-glutamate O-methyltransferase n=1 Tax=Capillimicrobium parvum TaxID=2884022 RepID=A0A9E6XRX9_9ACTN|nr:protein-glutamate O-methyltransferase CheR [Capillimicrobium parvum]UGS33737.1 Chemotaxis protein methyltransferase [Capillimicrobium parvum]